MHAALKKLQSGLIVSCQASQGSPLANSECMPFIAEAVAAAGASGVRLQGIADIEHTRPRVEVPIVGLVKRREQGSPIYITPGLKDFREIAEAGADIVAVDATNRMRADGMNAAEFLRACRSAVPGVAMLADIDDLDSALAAQEAGADAVATTLSGYTGHEIPEEPDIDLIEVLAREVDVPVIAEGRFTRPDQVSAAFSAGAWAVCVGTAITDPWVLTRRFLDSISRSSSAS